MLAPEKYKKFLSWITGWTVTLGWNANTASGLYFVGTMTTALIRLCEPSYQPSQLAGRFHATLCMLALGLVVIGVNAFLVRLLPFIGRFMLFLHFGFWCFIIIPMIVLSPHDTAEKVFLSFENNAGWSTDGLAFMVIISTTNLALLGYDAPCHMGTSLFITDKNTLTYRQSRKSTTQVSQLPERSYGA